MNRPKKTLKGKVITSKRGQKGLLTPELATNICLRIRAGVWDYIAAESYGISQRAFYEWIERGNRDLEEGDDSIYAQFTQDVMIAKAERRAALEIRVTDSDPKAALRMAHGRETADRPGWTESSEIKLDGDVKVALTLKGPQIIRPESSDEES